jgi:hypothetical protein
VQQWLNEVVVGLNLCPFAGKPVAEGRVRYSASDAQDEQQLLEQLQAELERLDATPAAELETTLLIVPGLLGEFLDYQEFLNRANALLRRGRWDSVYQIASFHPRYQFADTSSGDAENLTNRAPYPIVHIIREASIEKALQHYPGAGKIPENNIERMNALSDQEKQLLFAYLF